MLVPLRIALVPDDVDALAFAVLVLYAVDAGGVELAQGRDVVRPLVDSLFLAGPNGMERLELPPRVLLRRRRRSSDVRGQ